LARGRPNATLHSRGPGTPSELAFNDITTARIYLSSSPTTSFLECLGQEEAARANLSNGKGEQQRPKSV